jgi:thiol-disulfide isomerase/thioredoxin
VAAITLKKKIRCESSMNNLEKCMLIEAENDLEKILQTKNNIFVLFYAPWCPFSQRFLPIFEKCAKETTHNCYRMMIDEHPNLCEKYSVEVYPTIIFFEKGKAVKRLDGTSGVGLNEKQFRDLISACRSVK